MEDDKNAKAVYDEIKKSIENKTLSASNLIVIVTELIPIVEKVIKHDRPGQYKKKLLLDVLEMVINDSPKLDKNEKDNILVIVNTIIPPAVDAMIAIARGRLNIGKKIKNNFKCC